MAYTKGVGTLEKAIPIVRFLFIEGKRWIDKCRVSLWDAALFLLSSIIFKMQSRLVVKSWATARMSLIVKEDKSSMKNFIESPSFPELRKQARKTNESKERSIRTGSRFIKDPTLLILRKSRNSLAGNRRKLRLSAIFYES